jgi:hypothetical protein
MAISKAILATIVLKDQADKVLGGGLGPVYSAQDKDEQQKICMYLSRILEGVAHDLENGVMVVVRH